MLCAVGGLLAGLGGLGGLRAGFGEGVCGLGVQTGAREGGAGLGCDSGVDLLWGTGTFCAGLLVPAAAPGRCSARCCLLSAALLDTIEAADSARMPPSVRGQYGLALFLVGSLVSPCLTTSSEGMAHDL